jgi:hypothetical protein
MEGAWWVASASRRQGRVHGASDKPIELSPKVIPIEYARQILPGSFEYALGYLIDHEMELAAFAQRYRTDAGGAPAYAPARLLKMIRLAYSRG